MPSILEARSITKLYPGTVALDDVTVSFDSGKVHALVGKNGSGKSTLLKIIAGAEIKTTGSLTLDGNELSIEKPGDSLNLGMATVYQEMSVMPFFTVAENIMLSHYPVKKNGILIDWKAVNRRARELLDDLGIDIDPRIKLERLSIGQRQMVEIAKAMSTNPKVLQLDEPTSAITSSEVHSLFKLIRRLREIGVIIIYVSHRLHELWEIADTCTVLRDGKLVGTKLIKELEHKELIHMMFGDVEIRSRPSDLVVGDETVLEVRGLSRKDYLHDISFSLRKGEILGIAGMLGSGRTELLQAIFGGMPYDVGKIYVNGKAFGVPTPHKMKKAGLALTPEDRQRQGLILWHSIARNLTLAPIDFMGSGIVFDHKLALTMVIRQVKELAIKITSVDNMITSLSGGNQQKVVVGNWLNTNPTIMLFDEPSRGIDVSAKQQIFQIMWDQSRKGISSIMVSTELEELLEVCHRIIVIKDGRIIARDLDPSRLTVEDLYSISMGGKLDE
ncbi:MAG: sugar ABC transporter ATP-binding protein [Treponema sp.]|jgi:ribose transport system ATP-binding protein|nr:sugar ABC transporter ATP-binding protein [Treponema sp.]